MKKQQFGMDGFEAISISNQPSAISIQLAHIKAETMQALGLKGFALSLALSSAKRRRLHHLLRSGFHAINAVSPALAERRKG